MNYTAIYHYTSIKLGYSQETDSHLKEQGLKYPDFYSLAWVKLTDTIKNGGVCVTSLKNPPSVQLS